MIQWIHLFTSEVDLDSKGNLIDKTCEALAEHIYTQCEKVRQGSGEEIKQHIIEECITPSTFKDMTKDEFSTYLSSVKIPFGILKALEGVQSQIRRELSSSLDIKTNMILRNFDSPAAIVEYMKGKVKTQVGNLMVPAHAFRMVLDDEMLVIPDIIKQSIKFVAACMNGKQNGTIHFGIKSLGNGLGLILGLESTLYSTLAYLDFQLRNSIETCFEDVKVSNVKRCVRPFQIVCVEDGTCVIELDVIPLSAYATAHSYSVIFPPKGKQDSQLIVFSPDFCEIFCFKDKTKWEEVKSNCVDYLTRQNQESVKENHLQERKSCAARLVKALTAGGDYVTDQFTPIICCGKISENENEDYIRQLFDVPEAFLSSSAIFDFDSSVNLRNQVERGDTCFEVLTADKNIPEENDISDRIWVYCNGNTELDMTEMDLQNWYKHRFNAIKRIITLCGERIPFQRAIVIFLAFDKRGRKDPFLELAEDCIKSQFRGQCVVIAEADSEVSYLRNKLSEIMSQDDLSECFYTGMSWSETSNTLKTIFRTTTQCDYKLPCSNGHYILMTAEEKRKLNFTDIEIIGGEECKHISQADDDISRRKRKDDEQKKFYKGMDVSWWNFYYKDHVGPRDLHSKLLISAREKLSNDGKDLIETLNVWHQPGAGGSTSARYVLWCLSQFEEQGVKHSYRCCVVKQVTDDTAKQIYDFMSFKDDTPKPVILLTDNGNEDHMELLISRLNVLAYKHAIPRNLFALHIQVNRLSVLYSKCDEFVLKHALSRQEQSWFQSKYDQLEENKENVDTLIAFNVMRKGFDEGYIRRLTKELLSGVKDTEFSILKCLSLINTFGRDKVIPMSTFDCLVDQNNPINQSSVTLKTIHKSGPFGLVVPRVMARQKANRSQHWNVDMTDQLALLIKRRTDPNGVMLISQTLAKAVLEYIMGNENISLPNIVDYLLDVVQQHANKKNQMAKKFVEIVCSLFKTRSLLSTEENKEAKARFSDMVLSLMETNGSENDNERNINAAKLMHRCFKITSDPMVGQQLARFYIFMQEFESAENAINLSLELKPKSSYLVSTCGEVYKTKMEYMVKESTPPISDVETAKIIDTAFNAIDKFILGQKYARMVTNVEKSEITCFSKEIITTLSLLDNFKRFSCYQDRNNFLDFLNQPNFEIEKSTFKGVAGKCDIRRLQKGTDTQKHMEESLRRLQENHYQIKNAVYLVDKFIQEKQLDNFRERFETFYGTKESQCGKNKPYIAGLKSLMQANKKHKEYIHHRVTEAEINLQHLKDISCLNNAQTIDLLLVLGYKLIEISKSVQPSKAMSIATYEQLLHYSNILVEQQRSSSRAYLEAFLFFAILNWPSERRLQQIDCLCKPDRYKNILKQWRESFIKNHSNESFAKTYFVLGKGDLGCDIVDLDVCIRLPWYSLQRKEKRLRTNVSADNIWKQKFVVDRLQRLSGQCDGTGDWIEYKVFITDLYFELNTSLLILLQKFYENIVKIVSEYDQENHAHRLQAK